MKRKKEVLFDKTNVSSRGDWPSDQAYEFIAWFAAKIAEIPEEYRGSAEIAIDSVSGYEGLHYPRIEVVYFRPEE